MAKKTKDPGFGYNSQENKRGLINKDGSSNVIHINKNFNIDDLYTYFVEMSWGKFFLVVFISYTFLNIIFGLLYTSIGIEQITPSKGSFFRDFLNGFFFSAQTLTTVGYGGIAPKGITANLIAAFEAMLGLLSFSFITGLLYGRFAKPKAAIRFSENLLLRDFKNHSALMFRLINNRKTVMIEPEIKVTLVLNEKNAAGNYQREFHELKLERDNIMYLPTVWTVVHEIDTESPLYKYTKQEIAKMDAQVYILLKYHEESFGQHVYQATSYSFSDLEINKKYVPSSHFDKEGFTILNHEKLSEVEKMN
ncbi:ion channel [Tenacibaculum pacificus]|uniref:ion channel n=1 Tax=Tenacibaculum TaxID=104267 RepID=UPI0022F39197|nr:ion channel [Tenacibaculum pacificus]WBX73310.1 ion channel [Tenacibaculum pacificus]